MQKQTTNGSSSPALVLEEQSELVQALYREIYPRVWLVEAAVQQRGHDAIDFELANMLVHQERAAHEEALRLELESHVVGDGPPHPSFANGPRPTGAASNAFDPCHWPKRHLATLADKAFTLANLNEPQHRAYRKLEAAMRNEDEAGKMLVMLGNRGTGKTLLATLAHWNVKAQAAVDALELRRWTPHGFMAAGEPMSMIFGGTGTAAQYFVLGDMFAREKATFNIRSKASVLESARTARVLVLDEIQETVGSEWEQTELTRLIDHRYREMLPTILIGNLKSSELTGCLGDSIVSRLQETGEVIECNWKSYRRQV